MNTARLAISDVLLWLLRKTYPGRRGNVWQIIEVPRRISKTEGEQLAQEIKNL